MISFPMSRTPESLCLTSTFFNKFKSEYLAGWKINVIDNKLKDDAYLPDSQAANSEILFAIGVDPCLVGSGFPVAILVQAADRINVKLSGSSMPKWAFTGRSALNPCISSGISINGRRISTSIM